MLALWEEVSLGLSGRRVGEGRHDSQRLWGSASILFPVLTEVLKKKSRCSVHAAGEPQGGERLRGNVASCTDSHSGWDEGDGRAASTGSFPL